MKAPPDRSETGANELESVFQDASALEASFVEAQETLNATHPVDAQAAAVGAGFIETPPIGMLPPATSESDEAEAREAQSRSDADADVHGKAKRGIKLLMGRQVFLQLFTFAGGVVLARTLSPSEFGLYAIASFLVTTVAMFGDFGLTASFIQRQEELSEHDLRVGFTMQQIVTSGIVVVLIVAAPWLVRLYPKAPLETVWLVRASVFSLYLSSWRTISALKLERRMHYGQLARIEIVETLIYQLMVVVMAVSGYGVWSFVWAGLTRGLLGTILTFVAAPWKIRFALDAPVAREILRFGIPFQIQALVANGGVWITPLLVGRVIGPQAVGYLGWAEGNGKKPLSVVANVMRVAFPHFSRLQHDRPEVERTLTRYLSWLLLLGGFWFSLILVAGPALVHFVYTDKWSAAIPALILAAAALCFDTTSWVVVMALQGLGLVSFVTRVTLCRTVAFIVLSVPMVYFVGFNGVPVTYLVVNIVGTAWIFSGLGSGATRRVLMPLAWISIPIAVSCAVGLAAWWIPAPLAMRAFGLAGLVSLVYMGLAFVAAPAWLSGTIREKVAARFASA